MHYEVEQAGTGDEHRPDAGTHAEPERWHVVNVRAEGVPAELAASVREVRAELFELLSGTRCCLCAEPAVGQGLVALAGGGLAHGRCHGWATSRPVRG